MFKKNKVSRKKKQGKLRKITDLKKECWFWLSLYVRLFHSDKDGYCTCATTGVRRYYFKSGVDAGHFQNKSFGSETAYMFDNILPQSKGSNMKSSGDQYLMGIAINKLHKEGVLKYSADELITICKQSKIKLDRLYFMEKIVEYKEQVLKLSEEKSLWEWKENCLKKYLKDTT